MRYRNLSGGNPGTARLAKSTVPFEICSDLKTKIASFYFVKNDLGKSRKTVRHHGEKLARERGQEEQSEPQEESLRARRDRTQRETECEVAGARATTQGSQSRDGNRARWYYRPSK